jgi:hypothetical protein
MSNNNLFPCPSCGFLIFSEAPGSYEMCSICGWEDDPVQLTSPGMKGGANGGSLKEYQDDILKEIPLDILEYEGSKRAKNWRPLKDEEVINSDNGEGINYFHASLNTDTPKYYWEDNE